MEHWTETYPETAIRMRVELAESPGMGLLNLIEGADAAILVDAVQSGANPGTIHNIKEKDLAAFLQGADSAHGWGVAETLAFGRKIAPEDMPDLIVVIGVEIESAAFGDQLSPEIEKVLPEISRIITQKIQTVFSTP